MTKLRNLLVLTAASFFLLGSFIGCKKNSESPAPDPEETKTLESISLEVSPATLKVGEKAGLKVTATYSDKSTSDVSEKAVFTSSDTSVATFEGTSLTAVKEGSASVVALYTEGEKTVRSSSVAVTVSKADEPAPAEKTLVSITLSSEPALLTLEEGETATLKVTATYSDGKSDDVSGKATLVSGDTNVATISGTTLTAKAKGNTKVTAEYKEDDVTKTAEITVIVIAKGEEKPATLESIKLSVVGSDLLTLTVGESKDLKVTATYSDKKTEDVSEKAIITSESGHATVSGTKVTGVSSGEAKVTATYGGKTDSITFTVSGGTEPAKVTLTADYKTEVGQGIWFSGTFAESSNDTLIVRGTPPAEGSNKWTLDVTPAGSGSFEWQVLLGPYGESSETTKAKSGRSSDFRYEILEDGKHQYPTVKEVTPIFIPKDAIKLTAKYNAGYGNAIFFIGSFSESELASGDGGWKRAVRGTVSNKTEWTTYVTMPAGKTEFEWKAMLGSYDKGETVDDTTSAGLKHQSGDNNKYPGTTEITPTF